MSFSNPGYLWLLLFIIIPLILYLMPLPRKRINTSALFLWEKFLGAEPFGRSSERFKRFLGFTLTALIITLLVFAAADLSVGVSPVKAKSLIILMDNSASMNAVSSGKSNFEKAKAAAAKIAESLDAGSLVSVVEAADELRVIYPSGVPSRETVRKIEGIESFDGPVDVLAMLEKAFKLWGNKEGTEIYMFTDREPPESAWGTRVRSWIAPHAKWNAGIIALSAERAGDDIIAKFTVANYGENNATLSGAVFGNGRTGGTYEERGVAPGTAREETIRFTESGRAAVNVTLSARGIEDRLDIDNEARVIVPSIDEMRVNVVWPDIKSRNTYVLSVLAALRAEGVGYPVSGAEGEGGAASVFVNIMPSVLPKNSSVIICPYLSGFVEVQGLLDKPVVIDRQADDPLLKDVNLRGLSVKGVVLTKVPGWAKPLVWAEDKPIIWAGEINGIRIFYIGIPASAASSRLPLTPSFPALMKNSLSWMLPRQEILRAGEYINGWTSRKIGFIESKADNRSHAFSLLDAGESDLRNVSGNESALPPGRRSLAPLMTVLAMILLGLEWILFHKRYTE